MKQRRFFLLLLLAVPLLFVGCTEHILPVFVDESMLVGKWQNEANLQEYWRYDEDHKGETWDESEDVQEGEGTKFNWAVDGDMLQIDLYGEMGQHAYYDYTVVVQTSSRLEVKDIYGNKLSFVKVLL